MGVDTKGCVVTKNKDVFAIHARFEAWWSKVMKQNNHGVGVISSEWSGPRMQVSHFGCLNVFFKYKNEDRRLFIVTTSDCDLENHEEIEGDSCTWFILGNWGSSVEIMKSLLEEFKDFGDCYIDENDCDDVGYYKV